MTWLWVGLLGGAVGLDSTAFPQIMISRPLVAGALTGALLGRPYEGLLLGALLEVFHIATLPIGAARYPEAGTAAVAGVAAYAAATPELAIPVLFLAAVFALAWERVAGRSVVFARRVNERLVVDEVDAPNPARAIAVRHIAAMVLDFGRGSFVSAAGAIAGSVLLMLLAPLWSMSDESVRGVVAVAVATILAAALAVFGGFRERRTVFIAGLVCGTILTLLL